MALEIAPYMRPVVANVNARLSGMRANLERESFSTLIQPLVTSYEKVSASLTSLPHYNGTNATELKAQLDGVQIEYQNHNPILDTFQRLRQDLEYVGLLEQGGLDAVNTRVQYLFEQLKGTQWDKNIQQTTVVASKEKCVAQINDILYRAIHFFPHLAHGVNIQMTNKALDLSDDEWRAKIERYGRRFLNASKQGHFERICNLIPQFNAFTLPLPYEFKSNVQDGSSARNAAGASQNDVNVAVVWDIPVIGITIDLCSTGLFRGYTYFPVEDIEKIEFHQQIGKFTPYVDGSGNQLSNRSDRLHTYLFFRGMYNAIISEGTNEDQFIATLAETPYDREF